MYQIVIIFYRILLIKETILEKKIERYIYYQSK